MGYTYTVHVDDNYHYQDEGARYRLADFATLEDAIAACKKVVDQYLEDETPVDGPATERYALYTGFGPDPFIMTDDPKAGHPPFSAWTYARERCHGEADGQG